MFENIIQQYGTPNPTAVATQPAVVEDALEGLLGNLFKGREAKQKARLAQAIAKIDEIKVKYDKDHAWQLNDCQKQLADYTTAMTAFAAKIKGKKIDTAAFAKLLLPEYTVVYQVLKSDMDNHVLILPYVEKLFHAIDLDAAIAALRSSPSYTWYEELETEQMTPEGENTLAIAAGYPSNFVPYAVSTVAITKKALDAMITMSAAVPALMEAQKKQITLTSNPSDISVVVRRCNQLSDSVLYVLGMTTDEHRLREFCWMANLIVKHCYK